MTQEPERPKQMIRFDFKPGATTKEIAEAIQRTRERVVREYAARLEADAKAAAEKRK